MTFRWPRCSAVAVFTNTIPTQAYRSSGRPEVTFAIERLIDIAAGRARHRSGQLAPAQSGPAEGDAIPKCCRHALRQRPIRREHGPRLASADWEGFKCAPARSEKTGQAAWARSRELCRILDRCAKRTDTHDVRPEGRVECRHRHATGWARATKPALRRWSPTSCGAGRDSAHHPWRHRRGEGRRRHPFRPLHAPRRDRVFACRRGTDRQRQARDRAHPRHLGRSGRIQRRAIFGARESNRSFDFLELAEEMTRHHDAGRPCRQDLSVITDNEMHEPVFPNGCAICEIEIDPESCDLKTHPLHLGRRCRPLHQSADRRWPDPRRDRSGRRPGALGAMRRRSRFRPAAVRLIHGLRHAAFGPRALFRHARLSRCFRRPIRSASKRAAKAEQRPHRRRSSARSSMRSPPTESKT